MFGSHANKSGQVDVPLFVCKHKVEKHSSLSISTIQFRDCLSLNMLEIVNNILLIIITYKKLQS